MRTLHEILGEARYAERLLNGSRSHYFNFQIGTLDKDDLLVIIGSLAEDLQGARQRHLDTLEFMGALSKARA